MMGTMPRREEREEQARINVKFASTIVIAAANHRCSSVGEGGHRPANPTLVASVGQSVSLARLILNNVLRRFPGA